MHVDSDAAGYAEARPPYPPELWDRLRQLGLLEPGRSALDLGAGTGQATGPLLAAGLRVTAVEPGARLAAELRSRHPTATVVLSRAEDAQLGEHQFDLVVVATAIHWMDLDVLLPQVQRRLLPGGRFLVWRQVFGDHAVSTPFRDRIAAIVADRSAPPRSSFDMGDLAATRTALTSGGLFRVDEQALFRWRIELDDRQVHGLFSTFSDWSAEEVERAAAAVRELGGRVVEHYQSWLLVLSARGDDERLHS